MCVQSQEIYQVNDTLAYLGDISGSNTKVFPIDIKSHGSITCPFDANSVTNEKATQIGAVVEAKDRGSISAYIGPTHPPCVGCLYA